MKCFLPKNSRTMSLLKKEFWSTALHIHSLIAFYGHNLTFTEVHACHVTHFPQQNQTAPTAFVELNMNNQQQRCLALLIWFFNWLTSGWHNVAVILVKKKHKTSGCQWCLIDNHLFLNRWRVTDSSVTVSPPLLCSPSCSLSHYIHQCRVVRLIWWQNNFVWSGTH